MKARTSLATIVQVRYINGARSHIADNPTLNSLKGVKFKVEPPAGGYSGGGRGKGRGGGGGRGGGRCRRQATPLIETPQDSVREMFGDDGENVGDFDDLLSAQMHEESQQVTPIFGRLFSVAVEIFAFAFNWPFTPPLS